MALSTVLEEKFTFMETIMKECSRITNNMAKESLFTMLAELKKENLRRASLLANIENELL